jgi:hypothetical protein
LSIVPQPTARQDRPHTVSGGEASWLHDISQ